MEYNFDEIIDRSHTNSISFESWRNTLGKHKDEKFSTPDSEFIRMWVADMDFATPPEILDAIKNRVDQKILGYSTVFDPEYFTVLSTWFQKRYQWKISKEEIVLSPGVVPALNRLVPLLTDVSENILILTPSYAPFKNAGDLSDRSVFYSRLINEKGNYIIDFEDVAYQLSDKTKNIQLLIFCNPHNPTGRVWKEDELAKIAQLCISQNIWLISDEIHCDLLRNGIEFTPMSRVIPDYKKLIVCTAPSKTFNLAGNLVSHIFIRDENVRNRYQKLYFEVYNPLSLSAVKAAYQQSENWLEQLKIYLDETFKMVDKKLKTNLPKAVFKIPEATYLGWIDFSEYQNLFSKDETLTYFFAKNAGVIAEGGESFVDNGDFHLRINIAAPRSVIEKGIDQIITAIQEKEKI